MVRGKFKVTSVTHHEYSPGVTVKLTAVPNDGTPENERFHRYTPSGSIEMFIDNPPASDELKLGSTFYVDFTAVEK